MFCVELINICTLLCNVSQVFLFSNKIVDIERPIKKTFGSSVKKKGVIFCDKRSFIINQQDQS